MNNKTGKVIGFTYKQVITSKWFCMITILGIIGEFMGTQADKLLGIMAGGEIQNVSNAASVTDPSEIQFYLSFGIVITLFLLILIYGANIANSIVEEKSGRIIETLLCYVKPVELLAGKLFGFVAGIITQMALWIGYFLVLKNTIGYPEAFLASGINLSPQLLLLICGSMIFGFVMYAAAFVALASFADNAQDSTQLMLPVGVIIMAAYFLSLSAMNGSAGPVVSVLSYAPFFSSIMMFTRVDLLNISWGITVLNLLVQAVEMFLVIIVCSQIYRYGVVRYGMRKISLSIFKQ